MTYTVWQYAEFGGVHICVSVLCACVVYTTAAVTFFHACQVNFI